MAGTSIGEALARASRDLSPGSVTHASDVQVLMAEMTGRPREWLLAHPEAPLPREITDRFDFALDRLKAGEPLPYVLGWWEFYGRRFRVTPEVLIPRPETEQLVEAGLEAIDRTPHLRTVLDLGTGSGCIGVTLAVERPDARVLATDVSRAALRVARENAARLGAGHRVAFVEADLTTGLVLEDAVALANLPYVASADVPALRCEPRLALDGGVGGTDVSQRLLWQLGQRRPERTTLLFEIGAGQGGAIMDLAVKLCRPDRVWLSADLAGLDRIIGLEFGEAQR